MKRVFIALTALLLLFANCREVSATGFVIKGGLNFPSLDLKNLNSFDIKANTGWHAGIGYQTGSAAGFSFQPELNFVRNTIKISETNTTESLSTNMLQLVPNIQWGIDLIICKPFIFAAPYAALNLSTDAQYQQGSAMEQFKETIKKLDWGVGVGAGLNIWKFQVTGKYSWSFGNVVDFSQYMESLKDIKFSNGAFILSIALVL